MPGMDDRCWEWESTKDRDGYGRFYYDNKDTTAHRYAFMLGSGSEPPQVLHRCNNRCCVRFNHLAGGTYKDNLIDLMLRRVREQDAA